MHRRVAAAAAAGLIATAIRAPGAPAQAAAPGLAARPVPAAFQALDFTPQSVAWVTDSRLALTDMAGHQVVIADLNQPALRRIGREGAGPGEFRSPTFSLASPGGGLVVDDIAGRRISEFDSTLRYLRSAVTPGATLRLLDWTRNRVRLVWITFAADGAGPVVSDVDLAGGRTVDRFHIFARDSSLAVPLPGGLGRGPSPYVAAAPGPGGQIVVADPRGYRIVAFDSNGAVLRRFGRPDLPLVYRTADEVAAMMAQARRSFAGRPLPPDAVATMEKSFREQPKPRIAGGMAVDPAGRVWVATAARGARTDLDVFSPAGRFLGSASVPGRVITMAIRGAALAVVAERTGDEEGSYGLDIYRIR